MPNDKPDLKEVELCKGELRDLMEMESGLSGWETEFIDSVDARAKKGTLTKKQTTKIHEIWDQKCR